MSKDENRACVRNARAYVEGHAVLLGLEDVLHVVGQREAGGLELILRACNRLAAHLPLGAIDVARDDAINHLRIPWQVVDGLPDHLLWSLHILHRHRAQPASREVDLPEPWRALPQLLVGRVQLFEPDLGRRHSLILFEQARVRVWFARVCGAAASRLHAGHKDCHRRRMTHPKQREEGVALHTEFKPSQQQADDGSEWTAPRPGV